MVNQTRWVDEELPEELKKTIGLGTRAELEPWSGDHICPGFQLIKSINEIIDILFRPDLTAADAATTREWAASAAGYFQTIIWDTNK